MHMSVDKIDLDCLHKVQRGCYIAKPYLPLPGLFVPNHLYVEGK